MLMLNRFAVWIMYVIEDKEISQKWLYTERIHFVTDKGGKAPGGACLGRGRNVAGRLGDPIYGAVKWAVGQLSLGYREEIQFYV